MKPYVVVFAGVQGTSKTPIAHYLSITFKLPIISTDQIRYEIREDMRLDTIVGNSRALEEFTRRTTKRTKALLRSGHPFIFDSSMDRHWRERKQQIVSAGYQWFMIDMELSRSFLINLFSATGRTDFAKNQLDNYLAQHENFMRQYAADVNVQITDETFKARLHVAADALRRFLAAA